MRRMLPIGSALALMFALAAVGCSGRAEPRAVTIQGKLITTAGKPVAKVVLVFFPRDAGIGQRPTAHTDAEGRFATTGPAGHYKVVLTPLPTGAGQADPGSGTIAPPGKESSGGVPAAYRNVDETPLTAEVHPDGSPALVLTVR